MSRKNTLLNAIKEQSDKAAASARINAEEKLASKESIDSLASNDKHPVVSTSFQQIDNLDPDFDEIEVADKPKSLINNSIDESKMQLSVMSKAPVEELSLQTVYCSPKIKKTFEFDAHLMQCVENILRHQPNRSLVDFVETAVRGYARKLERLNGGPFKVLKDYRRRR